MPGRLEGRVALITGGASGIGEATSRLFVEEGATVLATDIQDGKGETLADALGPDAQYLHADVTSEADVQRAVGYATENFGRLDCMFNNAGIAG
ncbi:SDR family NAD(P)-dependent oxidoreductase, partial [Candidatus Bathyarchaeota archaeon]